MEEDVPKSRSHYTIGQDLSALSVEELKETIALLKEEIARLEHELKAKDTTRATADALFRRN